MNIKLEDCLKERILVLDGAMGTSIQKLGLNEVEFHGHCHCHKNQKGNNDILNITNPDIIKAIHRAYLNAGADIIETNTFNSNRISQVDYGLEEKAYELNYLGAKLARQCVDEYSVNDSKKFVAGAIGPTNRTASLSPDVENPGIRNISFDELSAAYEEQIEGLVDGGADILLIETIFDALNARAAIFAAENVFEKKGIVLPIMISGTITDKSGRILSGQTLEAFAESVKNDKVISIGLNCAFGARDLIPFIKELSRTQKLFISFYPNA